MLKVESTEKSDVKNSKVRTVLGFVSEFSASTLVGYYTQAPIAAAANPFQKGVMYIGSVVIGNAVGRVVGKQTKETYDEFMDAMRR